MTEVAVATVSEAGMVAEAASEQEERLPFKTRVDKHFSVGAEAAVVDVMRGLTEEVRNTNEVEVERSRW